MLFLSFQAIATYLAIHHLISVPILSSESVTHFVWLPLATNSSFMFKKLILVYANVFPNLLQVASPRIMSPILPPEFMYVTLRSVETPVAKSPSEATANEPPRSTGAGRCQLRPLEKSHERKSPMLAIVPPWRMPRRFLHQTHQHERCRLVKTSGVEDKCTVCSCLISSSKLTVPGRAAVTRS